MRFAVLVFFVFCAAASVRLTVAGYSFDLDTSAVQSSEYAERLAAIDPVRAREALERAIRWNPRSSSALIALGLAKEHAADLEGATRDLLRAAEVDHQYLPAWTLTNFYFRRGDRPAFRKWARRSAELVPGDLEPLLVLSDRMEPGNALAALRNASAYGPGRACAKPRVVLPAVTGGAGEYESRARDGGGQALSDEKQFARAYLDLLIRDNRLDDAERVAATLAAIRKMHHG